MQIPEKYRVNFGAGLALSILSLVVVTVVVAGLSVFNYQLNFLREQRFAELQAIGDLKSEQIQSWLTERRNDAEMIAASALREWVAEWLATSDPDLSARIESWLTVLPEHHDYKSATIVAPGGERFLSTGDSLAPLSPEVLELVSETMAADQTRLGQILESADSGGYHLDVATPIPDEAGKPVAAFVLCSDPAREIYGMIRRWPLPSESAETVLARIEGEDAVYLTELRHQATAPLSWRVPLSQTTLPMGRAAEGFVGQMEGVDYRGEAVLADVRPIAGTRWFLINKVDRAEVMTEAAYQGFVLLIIGVMSTALIGLALWFVVRSRSLRIRYFLALSKAERQRWEAEKEIQNTFAYAAVGLSHVDLEGRFLRVNRRLCEITGYSESDLLSTSVQDITYPAEMELDWDLSRDLLAGRINHYTMEKRYRHRDGHWVWVNLSTSLMQSADETPQYFIGVVEDISRRKSVEAALIESEQRHRQLFEESPLPMWIELADGSRILEVNAAALTRYGYDRETFVALRRSDLVAEGDADDTVQRHRYRDGEEVTVEVHTQHLDYEDDPACLVVVNDLEARLAAEREQRSAEARLAELTTQSPVVLYALRQSDTGVQVVYVSENIAKMSGYSVAEAQEDSWWFNHLHPEDQQRLAGTQTKVFEQDETTDEYRFFKKDGTCIWVRDERRLIRDANGEVIELVGSWSDITETQAAMNAQLEMKGRLERAEEYAGLGSWFYDIATNSGRFSREMFRLFGLPEEELAPSDDEFLDVIHPDDRYLIVDAKNAMAEGGPIDGQVFRSHPSRGPVHYFMPTWRDVRDEAGQVIRYEGTVLDITERVEREAELHAERERLSYILEGSGAGTWEWNAQTGSLRCNDRWAEQLGYTLAELQPLTIETWVGMLNPEDFIRMNEMASRHFEGKTPYYDCELRARHKDGSEIWLLDRGKVITWTEDGRPHLMYGTIMDIHESKMAEAALRESEERYRQLFENTLSGVVIVDAILDETGVVSDFIFVDANAATSHQIGMDLTGFVGKRMRKLSPGIEKNAAFQRLSNVATTCKPDEYEFYDWNFQKYFQVAAHCVSANRVALVFQDVTERKQNEAEIQKLSLAVEQSPASVLITDTEGHIEYVNAKFSQVTGYHLEEVQGENPRILKSGDSSDEEYAALWQTIHSGETWQGEFRNKRKDGTFYYERATISPIKDDDGQITQFLAVKEDITAQKQLERQFLQSQRLEAVGKLAGGVAHDFNNMLAVILGNAELALSEADPKTSLHKDLQEIVNAAQRSANLTRQLLAFARQQTSAPVVLHLNNTLDEMLRMMKRLIGENVELDWLPEPNLWQTKIDPAQIDQILANLLVNARDAIPDSGRVSVSTRNAVVDPGYAATHLDANPGEYVVLSVSDTGMGMSKETLARIFEPFFSTKAPSAGTGLGLATVYGIVKQNQGFITVYSELEQGSTFEIYLPREIADGASALTPAETPAKGGDETILLVEDEDGIRELGERILSRYGYTVMVAANASEALEQVESQRISIDLLLTDVIMPGMDGKALSERLQPDHPDMRVLYMSGYTADVIAVQGIIDDGVAFLHKPFTMRILLHKVREVLDQS